MKGCKLGKSLHPLHVIFSYVLLLHDLFILFTYFCLFFLLCLSVNGGWGAKEAQFDVYLYTVWSRLSNRSQPSMKFHFLSTHTWQSLLQVPLATQTLVDKCAAHFQITSKMLHWRELPTFGYIHRGQEVDMKILRNKLKKSSCVL